MIPVRRSAFIAMLALLLGLLACGAASTVVTITPTITATHTVATVTTIAGTLVPTATTAAAAPTATTVTSAPTATVAPPPTAVPWDTSPFFAASPDCVRDGAYWTYFNNGTTGTMTCPGKGVLLTPLSTINFSGVTNKLPPTFTLSITVSNMTPNAIASLILYLNGGSGGSSHVYYCDLYSTGQWVLRRYDPETILATGMLSPLTTATMQVRTSGRTRTFTINGTVVTAFNDGFTFSAASSSAFSLGGTSSDSALFRDLTFTPSS